MATVEIIRCTDPTELHRHYEGQSTAQPAYIELDLEDGALLADYNAEVGNGESAAVRHGVRRRWDIPVLTGEAANRVMEEIAPLAQRILSDSTVDWDGSNHVGRTGEDARAAEAEIEERLGLIPCSADHARPFDEGDLVAMWTGGDVVNGGEAEEYGIAADTTDARLAEIEAHILSSLGESAASGVAVCPDLGSYLRALREEDKREVWAVVAATGDRVDGAEMAELDQDAAEHLWTLPEFTKVTGEAGYGPEHPDVLIYLQTYDCTLTIPDGFEYVRLEVPSRVQSAIRAVERPA